MNLLREILRFLHYYFKSFSVHCDPLMCRWQPAFSFTYSWHIPADTHIHAPVAETTSEGKHSHIHSAAIIWRPQEPAEDVTRSLIKQWTEAGLSQGDKPVADRKGQWPDLQTPASILSNVFILYLQVRVTERVCLKTLLCPCFCKLFCLWTSLALKTNWRVNKKRLVDILS